MRDGVMVGDNDVQADAAAVVHFFNVADTAIDGDYQTDTLAGKIVQRSRIESIPLLDPVRYIWYDLRSQTAEPFYQQNGATDTVGIEVPNPKA